MYITFIYIFFYVRLFKNTVITISKLNKYLRIYRNTFRFFVETWKFRLQHELSESKMKTRRSVPNPCEIIVSGERWVSENRNSETRARDQTNTNGFVAVVRRKKTSGPIVEIFSSCPIDGRNLFFFNSYR